MQQRQSSPPLAHCLGMVRQVSPPGGVQLAVLQHQQVSCEGWCDDVVGLLVGRTGHSSIVRGSGLAWSAMGWPANLQGSVGGPRGAKVRTNQQTMQHRRSLLLLGRRTRCHH